MAPSLYIPQACLPLAAWIILLTRYTGMLGKAVFNQLSISSQFSLSSFSSLAFNTAIRYSLVGSLLGSISSISSVVSILTSSGVAELTIGSCGMSSLFSKDSSTKGLTLVATNPLTLAIRSSLSASGKCFCNSSYPDTITTSSITALPFSS